MALAPQSTTEILRSRLQDQQAQLVTPDRIEVGGGTPYSMMSSGINQMANALAAPEIRAMEQVNAERANEIRKEQLEYDRAQQEQREARNLAQAERESILFAQGQAERTARLKQQKLQLELQPEMQALQQESALRQRAVLAKYEQSPFAKAIPIASEMAAYDAKVAESGATSWDNMMSESFQKTYLSDASTRQNIMNDLQPAIEGGATMTGAKELVEKAGGTWNKAYQDMLVAKLMSYEDISSGFWGFNKGDFRAADFATKLAEEMLLVNQGQKLNDEVNTIKSAESKAMMQYQNQIARAGLVAQ